MIGTAFSVLIRLELATPGNQILSGDHQLFNGAPSNYNVHCVSETKNLVLTQVQSNPSAKLTSLKATTLASLGQLNGENSTVVKLSERMIASYNSHDEDNESLQLCTLVTTPDLKNKIYKRYSRGFLFKGTLFYVETKYLI